MLVLAAVLALPVVVQDLAALGLVIALALVLPPAAWALRRQARRRRGGATGPGPA